MPTFYVKPFAFNTFVTGGSETCLCVIQCVESVTVDISFLKNSSKYSAKLLNPSK